MAKKTTKIGTMSQREGSTLIFEDTQIPLQHMWNECRADSVPKKQLNPSIRNGTQTLHSSSDSLPSFRQYLVIYRADILLTYLDLVPPVHLCTSGSSLSPFKPVLCCVFNFLPCDPNLFQVLLKCPTPYHPWASSSSCATCWSPRYRSSRRPTGW